MSAFHCSCGFAIDDPDEFGDHFREVFDHPDDIGTDGKVHIEAITGDDITAAPGQTLTCTCGFQSALPEFDDHLLLVRIPADNRGNDAETHIPIDTSTPRVYYLSDDYRRYLRDDDRPDDGEGEREAG